MVYTPRWRNKPVDTFIHYNHQLQYSSRKLQQLLVHPIIVTSMNTFSYQPRAVTQPSEYRAQLKPGSQGPSLLNLLRAEQLGTFPS